MPFITTPEQLRAWMLLCRTGSLSPEPSSNPVSGDVQPVRAPEVPEASAASTAP